MDIKEYKNKMVALLRRHDIASAGSLLYDAAECILYCSECSLGDYKIYESVSRLEKAIGIQEDE